MPKKSELFSAIAAEMKSLGFKRRKSNYEYVLDLGPGFEGYCSFADASKGEKSLLWVATFAGVRCDAIEDRITAWCGDPVPGWDGRSYVTTVRMNVGYLTGTMQWLEHQVDLTEQPVESSIRATISDVTDTGLSFMREHASYAGIAEALNMETGQLSSRLIERIPLALALQGDVEGAYRELAPMKRKIADENNMMFRYMRLMEGFEREFPSS